MFAQYVNTVETRDWSFEAFGGRWGISEYEMQPFEQMYTQFWIYGEVAEIRVPMMVVLTCVGLLAVLAIGGRALLTRWRKRGE